MREQPSGRGRPGDIPFGNRTLTEDRDVFEHNAWDNMPWNEEMEEEAKAIVRGQKEKRVDEEKRKKLLEAPADQWDSFYSQHNNKFFMDRNWLLKEFPELDTTTAEEPIHVLEVGCGVGNTTFPLLDLDTRHKLVLTASDFSRNAVDVLRDADAGGRVAATFVWDITVSPPEDAPPAGSQDFILCIYVLSAIEPSKLPVALRNLKSLLKPGGALLIKDYGRYDLTQLRFKADRLIDDNLYCRGDGTLVYFFDSEELDERLRGAGLEKEANVVDRRLIVNRAKRNKRLLLRLSAETLKYKTVFDGMLEDEAISSLLNDDAIQEDVSYLYVVLYEFLVGNGTKGLPMEVADLLKRHSEEIYRRERELSSMGRGILSIKDKKEETESNVVMPRYARINTLKWSEEEALKTLEEEEWKIVRMDEGQGEEYVDRIRRLQKDEVLVDPHVSLLLAFPFDPKFHTYWMVRDKYVILQDKASCLPAFLLDPPQGSHVIDACAAPGMKTSHLAAILDNTGRIDAFDRAADRVHTMREMIETSGVTNTTVVNGDFLKVDVNDRNYADVEYALVDPPCSGSGIVKRMNEWLDETRDDGRLGRLANLQAMLLKHALRLPAMRRVVYSTCSVHEEENERVVEEVLKDISDFAVVEGVLPEWTERGIDSYEFGKHCLRADARKTATNGFFVAVFERVDGTGIVKKEAKRKRNFDEDTVEEKCKISERSDKKGSKKKKVFESEDEEVQNNVEKKKKKRKRKADE